MFNLEKKHESNVKNTHTKKKFYLPSKIKIMKVYNE